MGWTLQLAIADEANGTAWAITARDADLEPKTPKFGASVALSATSAPNFG